jgi:hypothetical protein
LREHALTQASCTVCGARLDLDADWCGQCYAATTEVVRPSMFQTPPPSPVVREPSRMRGGATTFGPRGRIGITAAVVGVAILGGVLFAYPYFSTRNPVAIVYPFVFLGPYSTVAWLVLRDVWKRSWRPVEVLQVRPPADEPPAYAASEPEPEGSE